MEDVMLEPQKIQGSH